MSVIRSCFLSTRGSGGATAKKLTWDAFATDASGCAASVARSSEPPLLRSNDAAFWAVSLPPSWFCGVARRCAGACGATWATAHIVTIATRAQEQANRIESSRLILTEGNDLVGGRIGIERSRLRAGENDIENVPCRLV